jgi:hypothetical protein
LGEAVERPADADFILEVFDAAFAKFEPITKPAMPAV